MLINFKAPKYEEKILDVLYESSPLDFLSFTSFSGIQLCKFDFYERSLKVADEINLNKAWGVYSNIWMISIT